jgi:hypothetical protein
VLGEIGGFEGLVLMLLSAFAGVASLVARCVRTSTGAAHPVAMATPAATNESAYTGESPTVVPTKDVLALAQTNAAMVAVEAAPADAATPTPLPQALRSAVAELVEEQLARERQRESAHGCASTGGRASASDPMGVSHGWI